MESVTFLEKTLDRQLAWIRAADTRLSLILPLSTAMLAALAAIAPPVETWPVGAAIFASFSALFLSLSVLFCALSSFPRTDGPKGSMIYFAGIAAREVEQFRAAAKSFTDEEYVDDLVSQCHVNATIAESKYRWIKRGMASLLIATAPWMLTVYLLWSGS